MLRHLHRIFRRLLVAGSIGGAVLAGGAGCSTVEFYEKGNFSDPIMQFDPDPTETHFYQKTYYSREGSAGGIGTSAGGGCGCY